ncbi:methyltransferase-like protein 25 [Thalassophryne amazonica]|uniref:methyltransferase-like protein 25 n=1 Tax=Thalassophryne amazonica TaxID=390379 RepID=UPI001471EA04|nr:methyltransferase-like protein 25 [Thalassophryne amazonica]
MSPSVYTLTDVHRRIDEVKRFLSVALRIANAHTVEFYTHGTWARFVAVSPEEVLSAISLQGAPEHKGDNQPVREAFTEKPRTTFGFCNDTSRLINTDELLKAAKAHSLPSLSVCTSRDELLEVLRRNQSDAAPAHTGAGLEPDEFMNLKKSHEVQCMSEVVSSLARYCGVKQVIDVGSGKGYLSSFLSLQYGLHIYGIDSSSTNTHGAQERNRKLKRFSRAYQKNRKAARDQGGAACSGVDEEAGVLCGAEERERREEEKVPPPKSMSLSESTSLNPEAEELFLSALSLGLTQTTSQRVPPDQLSAEERERRKQENLERKARNRAKSAAGLFSPLTSFVTECTELGELIKELQEAVVVGLHTCGDLAPNTLRMFAAKPELASACSVGCCYHLLSEEFDPDGHGSLHGARGFPLSQYLRDQSWFCSRNARMSACLALERVSLGQGIQMESLFYRAVLHVILRDHYSSFKSEKRVGNVYSKAKSFVDYVQRALRKLDLDEFKLSESVIQGYHDTYRPRMGEMQAFNMLKVTLAPCIEGLILLDRLCYLKEQENVAFSALVQLFDPLLSPRCYAVIGVKRFRELQTDDAEEHNCDARPCD